MIEIKFLKDENKAVVYDNKNIIGECQFVVNKNTWNIIHTQVNKEYQGQKIARNLVNCVIEKAKENNKLIVAECSYAKKIIDNNIKMG